MKKIILYGVFTWVSLCVFCTITPFDGFLGHILFNLSLVTLTIIVFIFFIYLNRKQKQYNKAHLYYDEYDNIVSIRSKNSRENVIQRVIFEDGMVTTIISLSEAGKVQSRVLFSNANGRLIAATQYINESNELKSHINWDYTDGKMTNINNRTEKFA